MNKDINQGKICYIFPMTPYTARVKFAKENLLV